jgi:cyanate permease
VGGFAWLIPWLLLAPQRRSRKIASAGRSVHRSGDSLLGLFRSRIMWGILIGTFCYNYFVYFCMTWLPAYLVERARTVDGRHGHHHQF